ncbi:30S ribosomal protein S4 [Candidatus Pacearchaeota archaeon]|nr:30S ribosomal protein S4 [Candidatus Pacearchaeota archaeon]
MKRKHKKYSKPKRPFDKARIEEEAQIIKEFGLKNKKEIWKAEAKINSMREKAKKMINADEETKQKFYGILKKIGLDVKSLADVLSLDRKDYLNRRLQTVVFKKNLAPTVKTARQMIVHKKVIVNGNIINRPSYIVPVELENKITIKGGKKKPKPAKEQEAKEEKKGEEKAEKAEEGKKEKSEEKAQESKPEKTQEEKKESESSEEKAKETEKKGEEK